MAMFCTKCGKKLEEGQSCDCEKEKNVNNTPQKNNTNFDVNELFKDYLDIVKGLFTAPIDTIKKYTKTDKFVLGIIAMVINCLISGVFFYFLMDKTLGGLFGFASRGYGSLMSSSVSLPFGKVFLMGLLFMVLWFLVCASAVYVIANPIMKDKLNIKEAFALTGVCSIFTTLTTLASLLFIFISVKISIIILLLGATFYLTYLYQGLSEITAINKNRLAYVFVSAVGLATFLAIEIVPRLFS